MKKWVKILIELVFYLALLLVFFSTLKTVLNTKSLFSWVLLVAVLIVLIHQVKDDITLWFLVDKGCKNDDFHVEKTSKNIRKK